jgi:alkylation response protein AidB-like acyl-CoA dehydrogenase
MKEMGIFGLMIPEEYGGLGESLLTYALCVEEIARGWMSVSGIINTHFIVAYMLLQHGTEEQKQRYLPADGDRRGARSVLDERAGLGSDVSAIKTKAVKDEGRWLDHQRARRCGSPTVGPATSSPSSCAPTREPTRSTRT